MPGSSSGNKGSICPENRSQIPFIVYSCCSAIAAQGNGRPRALKGQQRTLGRIVEINQNLSPCLGLSRDYRHNGEKVNQGFLSALLAVGVLSLAACATSIPINGDTKAGDTLKSDTARKVSMWARAETKCDRIDSIETKVISVNPVGTGKSEASRKYGSVDERWVVNLCGNSIPFSVTFTPDGQGGTFFTTSRERKK